MLRWAFILFVISAVEAGLDFAGAGGSLVLAGSCLSAGILSLLAPRALRARAKPVPPKEIKASPAAPAATL